MPTTYSAQIGSDTYPVSRLRLRKYMDLRPGVFTVQVPYQSRGFREQEQWVRFGKSLPVLIFRDGELYMVGSVGACHDLASLNAPATTTVVGLDLKKRLLRRFEKAGSSTVTYGAPGSTEVAIFSDILDTPTLGLTEGVVDATTVSGLQHVFKGYTCAHALEILEYLAGRECYVRNDASVDFQATIGAVKTPELTWGGNIELIRRTEDGFRVYNDIEIWYNKGASTSTASDSPSITQFGELDLTADLYSVTDATAVARYRDNILRDYKLPIKHAAVTFRDMTSGFEYDVGDWVILNVADYGLAGQYRVMEIAKQYGAEFGGELTTVLLGPPGVKAYDTRRYRAVDLNDSLSVVQVALQSLGRY